MIVAEVVIMCILALCVTRNEHPLRFWVAGCLFGLMAISIGMFYTSWYDPLVRYFGLHVYLSLYNVVFIGLLAYKPSRLGYLMIGVSILAVSVNALSYWVDLNGDSTVMFGVLMGCLLVVQVALLLSKRLTNGVYGSLTSLNLVRRLLDAIPNNLAKSKGQAG